MSGFARLFIVNDLVFAVVTIAVAFLVLLIAFVLFTRQIIGGGDAKLLTAAILLVGYHHLYPFFVVMAICGALLSIIVLIMRSHLPFYLGPRIGSAIVTTTKPVPYGIAIATGAIFTLLLKTSSIG